MASKHPELLPAFKLSQANAKYPLTPVSTSTGNLPSSPGFHVHCDDRGPKIPCSPPSDACAPGPEYTDLLRSSPPRLACTQSPRSDTGSVRTPLANVAICRLPLDGNPVTLGRSSKSSDIALSAKNKLVSRVHARLHYDSTSKLVVVTCLGWNAVTVTVPERFACEEQAAFPINKNQSMMIAFCPGLKLIICGELVLVEVEDDPNDETEDEVMSNLISHPNINRPAEHAENLPIKDELPLNELDVNRAAKRSAPEISNSPKRRTASDPPLDVDEIDHIKNLASNYLAFSRAASLPLTLIQKSSTRLMQLPRFTLRQILEQTSCIGEIKRIGKDAAGKPLDEEYYYDPEHDPDESRRRLVQESRGRTIRSCRKTHKQYYWKKPAGK